MDKSDNNICCRVDIPVAVATTISLTPVPQDPQELSTLKGKCCSSSGKSSGDNDSSASRFEGKTKSCKSNSTSFIVGLFPLIMRKCTVSATQPPVSSNKYYLFISR